MVGLHPEADDYIIPRAAPDGQTELPPVPPTRGRRPGSRGTSLADEDRTSRGAESLPSERDLDNDLPDDTHNEDDRHDDIHIDIRVDDYAFVDKTAPRSPPPKPDRPRRPKPPRPPAPGRRAKRAPPQTTAGRLHTWSRQFFSLPTRRSGKQAAKQDKQTPVPVRPARNYSTLGPARPPRSRRGSRHTAVYTTAYLEIQDHVQDEGRSLATDSHESRADLQSGEVISRMKDRPLPAPPRPPRKTTARE